MREEARVGRHLVADGPEQLVFITAAERTLPDQHLIEKHAERPPVNRLIVL